MSTLIAIPVHNERDTVNPVLDRVLKQHPEVLVVDDGSTDGSDAILARRDDVRVLRHRTNSGYGKSLIDAFAYAEDHGFDWVVTMDCDEQHEPEHIPAFLEAIADGRWDIVSGSRYLAESEQQDQPPQDRRRINHAITSVLNVLYPLQLTDAFCGFKAHRVSATQALGLSEAGYAFPLQLWPRVARAKLRLKELPVRLIYNDPNRQFGGGLDESSRRLRHYLAVLQEELAEDERAADVRAVEPTVRAVCGCSND